MKITDKIVTSVTPPQQTNVVWHNPQTGELKMFGNGWEVVGGKPGDDLSTAEDDFKINEVIPEEITYPNFDTLEVTTQYGYEIKSNCYNRLLPPPQTNNSIDVVIYTNPKNIINEDGEFCLITIPGFTMGILGIETFNLGGVLNKNNKDIEGYPFRYKFMINDYLYDGNANGYGYLYFSEDPTIGEERIIEEFISFGEIKETISKQKCILKFNAKIQDFVLNQTIDINIDDYDYISYIKTENIYNVTEVKIDYGLIPIYHNRIMFEIINGDNTFLISPYSDYPIYIKIPEYNVYTSEDNKVLIAINKIFNNQYIKINDVFQTILELPANTNSCTITTQLYWNNDTPPELEGNNITISIFDNKASFHKSSY